MDGRTDDRHGLSGPMAKLRLSLSGSSVGHMLGSEVNGDLFGRNTQLPAPGAELLHGRATQTFQDLRKRRMVGLQKRREGPQRITWIDLLSGIEFALETVAEHSPIVRAQMSRHKKWGGNLPRKALLA